MSPAPGKLFVNIPYGDRCVMGLGYKIGDSEQNIRKTNEEIVNEFAALSPNMKVQMNLIDKDSRNFVDDLMYVSLDRWYKGNVVLIGDSRHGVSPLSGFGTTLAIQDAYYLAESLKQHTSVKQVFKSFSVKRDRQIAPVRYFIWLIEYILLSNSWIARILLRITPEKYPLWVLRKAISN